MGLRRASDRGVSCIDIIRTAFDQNLDTNMATTVTAFRLDYSANSSYSHCICEILVIHTSEEVAKGVVSVPSDSPEMTIAQNSIVHDGNIPAHKTTTMSTFIRDLPQPHSRAFQSTDPSRYQPFGVRVLLVTRSHILIAFEAKPSDRVDHGNLDLPATNAIMLPILTDVVIPGTEAVSILDDILNAVPRVLMSCFKEFSKSPKDPADVQVASKDFLHLVIKIFVFHDGEIATKQYQVVRRASYRCLWWCCGSRNRRYASLAWWWRDNVPLVLVEFVPLLVGRARL